MRAVRVNQNGKVPGPKNQNNELKDAKREKSAWVIITSGFVPTNNRAVWLIVDSKKPWSEQLCELW